MVRMVRLIMMTIVTTRRKIVRFMESLSLIDNGYGYQEFHIFQKLKFRKFCEIFQSFSKCKLQFQTELLRHTLGVQ